MPGLQALPPKEDNLSIKWLGDKIKILDQTRLPQEEIYLELESTEDIASAIRELKVRGAPAIGVLTAYAVALSAVKAEAASKDSLLKTLDETRHTLAATRPTARNLFWALERMAAATGEGGNTEDIKRGLVAEAVKIHQDQLEDDSALSEHGAALIPDDAVILTHCNTGGLATGAWGTALGVIKVAFGQGKRIEVIATETRPLLQGARLTCWELQKAGIPFNLITDSMAGHFMHTEKVSLVILGADRIARNGDTANKIGTYSLAVLAKENGIPFYVAAPTTTIDTSIATGADIAIEERAPEEVTRFHGVDTAPAATQARNPAFDVTPHRYISAIVTEKGVMRGPYEGLETSDRKR